jgi:hypothetical protein
VSDQSVYFMENVGSGLIKIGISGDVKKRKRALEQAVGQRLTILAEVPGGRELERVLHQSFSDLRQMGEWFTDSPRLREFIATALRIASGDNSESEMRAAVPDECIRCPRCCPPVTRP